MKTFCVALHFLLFLILYIYRDSCIGYLQVMRPMGVVIWLLVSVVVYVEFLNAQSSVALAPHAILAPGMHVGPVMFKPLSQN